jgi:hypothetical protein
MVPPHCPVFFEHTSLAQTYEFRRQSQRLQAPPGGENRICIRNHQCCKDLRFRDGFLAGGRYGG